VTRITRRSFLIAGAVTLSMGPARARQAGTRYPIAFSTLGCPKWSWRTILDTAVRDGYAAVELRGLEGNMDLPGLPRFSAASVPTVLADLDALSLRIASVDSSVMLHSPDAGERAKAMEDGRRFIDLGHRLRSPYMRVFGDKLVPGEDRSVTISRVGDGLRSLGAYARGSGVTVLIESHGDFTDSASLRSILERSGDGTALLWDAHHTVVSAKEAPADTFRQLGRFVRHTHLKDSRPSGDDVQYVLTGSGSVPVRDTVRVLAHGGYRGYYCLEWEKAWHPELEEPEIAFPHYARVMRQYLAEAGVKPGM
jgi:sugar phosphate isomerase/epimerase